MKGQKHCRHTTDIKAVCPRCSKRYFFPIQDYKNTAMFEALLKNRTFDLICPWCWDAYSAPEGSVTIDLTSMQEWYGDPAAKPKLRDIYDVMYLGDTKCCDEFEKEIKEKFPEAKLEKDWDDIHEYRMTVALDGSKRVEYIQWVVFAGWAAVSFLIQMVVTNASMRPKTQFDMEDDLQIIKQAIEKLPKKEPK